jgi:C-terminal processing protease CtpA/Prc
MRENPLFVLCFTLLLSMESSASDRSAALEAAMATITAGELREHAGLLADDTLEGRAAGSRGGLAAGRYIESQLKKAGMTPAGDGGGYVQRFSPGYQNLLAKFPGADPKLAHEHIIVGAHYDHVGYGNRRNSNGPVGYIHNGADDNASGVATLLELIDAIARSGWQPRRTIIFAFWDGEEINLLGSRHWVRQPTVSLKDVRLAVNVDMIGRMTGGRLEVAGTRTAAGLRQLLSSSKLPADMWLDFTWQYEENSDHWPFYEASVPSLLIHTGVHNDYHRPSDDVEKLNIAGMRDATAYLFDAVSRAADADDLQPFRSAARSENAATRRMRETPLAPMAPRLGLRWDWQPGEGEPRMIVSRLTPGGAAEKAGVLVGDRITAVDGAPMLVEALLPAAVLRAEDEVSVEVIRGEAEPPLGRELGAERQTINIPLSGQRTELGLSWREDAAAPGAVYVTRVVPYSPADRAGIAVHDRIYALNGEPFADQDALLEGVRKQLADSDAIQLEIETRGRVRTIHVDLNLPTPPAEDPTL